MEEQQNAMTQIEEGGLFSKAKHDATKSSGYVKTKAMFPVPRFEEVRIPTENTSKERKSDTFENPWLNKDKLDTTLSERKIASSVKVSLDFEGALSKAQLEDNEETRGPDKAIVSETERKRKEQVDLLKRAFVNAGIVEEEFEAEMEQSDGKKDENDVTALPGWGSWAGEGVLNTSTKKDNQDKRKMTDTRKRKATSAPKVISFGKAK